MLLWFLLSLSSEYRVEVGAATIYYPGDGNCGTHKADGTRFTKKDNHIAHRRLPLGTPGFVCNIRTGACVRTVVSDRGPWGAVIPCRRYKGPSKGGIGTPKRHKWGRVCFWWQAQIKLQPGWKRRGKFDLTRLVARAIGHKAFDRVVFFYSRVCELSIPVGENTNAGQGYENTSR
jgi:hypothetical protein